MKTPTPSDHPRPLIISIVFLFTAFLLVGSVVDGVGPRHQDQISQSDVDEPHVCTERGPVSIGAAALRDRVWQKAVLQVQFLNGTDFLKEQVRHYAQFWTKYANVRFDFVESGPSDIRISFDLDGASWSYIGTAAKYVPENEATMHFGWFVEQKTESDVFRATILHEFGHALGLIHEHQSPIASFMWNKPKVYAHYKDKFGWNKNKVDDNILRKYSKSQSQYSSYDPYSIMVYPIPAQFTLNGTSVPWNTDLSNADIAFIKKLYP